MKQTLLKYVELKSGFEDDGPAWIGYVLPSKSGRTIYFNDRALQIENGGNANYVDLETGERFWISGVKHNETNRHWAAKAKTPIQIDRRAVAEFCAMTRQQKLDPREFQIVDLEDRFPVDRIKDLKNRKPENQRKA